MQRALSHLIYSFNFKFNDAKRERCNPCAIGFACLKSLEILGIVELSQAFEQFWSRTAIEQRMVKTVLLVFTRHLVDLTLAGRFRKIEEHIEQFCSILVCIKLDSSRLSPSQS
jgi:hypothetical protein